MNNKYLVFALALIAAISGAYLATGFAEEEIAVCPADVKVCPDGSYMSRAGPDCTFPLCPGEEPPE